MTTFAAKNSPATDREASQIARVAPLGPGDFGGKELLDMIKLKRAYEPAAASDGTRYLVERLWPRGVRKEALQLDAWLKDVAPSDGLRRWFSHDPAKWTEFIKRYTAELDANADAWKPILEAARRSTVTLVFSAHDTGHNNAVVLKDYLEAKLKPHTTGTRATVTARRARPRHAA